jgi:hypothetical protein
MKNEEPISRFPLAWPMGWIRTQPHKRQRAAFRKVETSYHQGANGQYAVKDNKVLSVIVSVQRLEAELDRLGARNVTLSTNVELRLDGRPRSDSEPKDPGAAVYFAFRGKATVFACDRYTRVADNIAAIAAHIDALRRIERYGVGTIEQALAGYKALPADSAANWRQVFGFSSTELVTPKMVTEAHRRKAIDNHPDKGGTDEAMIHFNRARDFALSELGG